MARRIDLLYLDLIVRILYCASWRDCVLEPVLKFVGEHLCFCLVVVDSFAYAVRGKAKDGRPYTPMAGRRDEHEGP